MTIAIMSVFGCSDADEWGEHIDGVIDRIHVEQSGAKIIALTLDICGSNKGPGIDKELAQYLHDNKIKATLFINKRFIDKNPDDFLALAASEYFDIQNHGTQHRPASITGRSAWGIRGFDSKQELIDEIQDAENRIYEMTGRRTTLYRSGTAFYETAAMKIIHGLGYKVIGFAVNGDHGASDSADTVEQNLAGAKSGDIIINHMNHPASGVRDGMIAAIDKWKSEGVQFVFVKDYLQ